MADQANIGCQSLRLFHSRDLSVALLDKRGKTMKRGPAEIPHPIDCYVLNDKALRVGDVILTASPKHAMSEMIQLLTSSSYSHAILVLNPPYAIESSDYGVVKFRLDRFAVRAPANIAVRRLRPDLAQDFDFSALVKFSDKLKTREYADRDMLLALFTLAPRFEQGKFFCSQLVAEAYANSGLKVVPGRKPEKTTPGMLADSNVFHPVDTDSVLRFCKSSDLCFVPALLDDSNPRSPAEWEADARQQVVRMITPTFIRHGQPVQDFYQALHTLIVCYSQKKPFTLELDQAFAAAILESNLLYIMSAEFPSHNDGFFIDFYVRNAILLGQMPVDKQRALLEHNRTENERMQVTNKERDADVTKLKEIYLRTGLESVRLHLAGCWESFLGSRRIELARQRVIEILEASLNGQPQP